MNFSESFEDTHTCPGGCGQSVVRNLFACRSCWRRLPQDYRTPILTTRWAGDNTGHSRALVDAMYWFRLASDQRAIARDTE